MPLAITPDGKWMAYYYVNELAAAIGTFSRYGM
jgi:hypothetical protein